MALLGKAYEKLPIIDESFRSYLLEYSKDYSEYRI
jgi:hypothetical protein